MPWLRTSIALEYIPNELKIKFKKVQSSKKWKTLKINILSVKFNISLYFSNSIINIFIDVHNRDLDYCVWLLAKSAGSQPAKLKILSNIFVYSNRILAIIRVTPIDWPCRQTILCSKHENNNNNKLLLLFLWQIITRCLI